jgi:hypothetical protein
MQAIGSLRSLWPVGLDAVVVALDLVPCLQIRHCLTRIGYFLRQKWPVIFFFVHLQIPHGEGDQYQSDENDCPIHRFYRREIQNVAMAIARTVDDHTMTRSHNGRRSPMTGAIQLIIWPNCSLPRGSMSSQR